MTWRVINPTTASSAFGVPSAERYTQIRNAIPATPTSANVSPHRESASRRRPANCTPTATAGTLRRLRGRSGAGGNRTCARFPSESELPAENLGHDKTPASRAERPAITRTKNDGKGVTGAGDVGLEDQ